MIAVMIRIGNWMLTEPATCKDYLQVRQEGSRRVSRNLRVGEKNKRIKPMQNHYDYYEIIIERVTANTWAWRIVLGGAVVGGGYCRTRRDAMNDAGIVFSKLEPK